ncbi:aminotransferase class I/II-fold pyridoxal phosphate-dependent enzyme [Flavicella marina]|uniref:aminotransferase class I/II-fold pyridoxal phosphate-dependent enzyme n=1 Tax=Flavicella marina TaxID=1475951 RepID=UPI001264E89B|nr:pyridoxal phosphate-dependent aminotransferase family protein [Flavicella marina]
MQDFPKKLTQKLKHRTENNSLRNLTTIKNKVDFSSNDYLGFSLNNAIVSKASSLIENETHKNGSTGSRLVSGSHHLHEVVEKQLAAFHNSSAALLFNSGYDANLGFFSCIPQKGDTILFDELIHASIRDGIRLSNAKSYKFKHNSTEDLEKKIAKSEGDVYVIVESIYSMDGDSAPLEKIAKLCELNNCYFVIDEAHSNGVFGESGAGLVQELQLENKVFARIHTFGKALGCHGAVILGSDNLRSYLINFSRSFIYTTAASLHSVATIKAAYDELTTTDSIQKLKKNINYFTSKISELNLVGNFIDSNSAIHCCIISGNDAIKKLANKLQIEGFDIKPILSPTVPKGEERLRICLHSYNTFKEIDNLLLALAKHTI